MRRRPLLGRRDWKEGAPSVLSVAFLTFFTFCSLCLFVSSVPPAAESLLASLKGEEEEKLKTQHQHEPDNLLTLSSASFQTGGNTRWCRLTLNVHLVFLVQIYSFNCLTVCGSAERFLIRKLKLPKKKKLHTFLLFFSWY